VEISDSTEQIDPAFVKEKGISNEMFIEWANSVYDISEYTTENLLSYFGK